MDENEFLGKIYKNLGDIKESVGKIAFESADIDDVACSELQVIGLALTAVQDMLDTRAQTLRREVEKDAE